MSQMCVLSLSWGSDIAIPFNSRFVRRCDSKDRDLPNADVRVLATDGEGLAANPLHLAWGMNWNAVFGNAARFGERCHFGFIQHPRRHFCNDLRSAVFVSCRVQAVRN